jgi:hypothetical protein
MDTRSLGTSGPAAIPFEAVAGERYHAEQMASLDSERG